MHEPVTYDLFDWSNEHVASEVGSPQWSLNEQRSLQPEHLYTMRVLEVWLDNYPEVFVEFPQALVSIFGTFGKSQRSKQVFDKE